MTEGQRYRRKRVGPQTKAPELVVLEVHDDMPVVDWTNEPTCLMADATNPRQSQFVWEQRAVIERCELVTA